MSPAERFIKSQLDGYFFTFGEGGRIVVQEVARDFIPTHGNFSFVDLEALRTAAQTRNKPWTEAEVETLLTLRDNGASWSIITRALRRGKNACRARYEEFRGTSPVKVKRRRASANSLKLTEKQKGEIVRLREAGMCFMEIEERLGLPEMAAAEFWQRFTLTWGEAA